jgi:AmiR/NasT family two-component response regulator
MDRRWIVDETHHLRVLIANQRTARLALLADVVSGLGHEVIARTVRVEDVGALTALERPDVALVGLGESSEHALQLISEIVRGAFCPVIALLETYDAAWVNEAAERGIYAYIVDTRPEELQSAIDITLRRFHEFLEMQGAFERRDAESLRVTEARLARQRQMLELHDGVVQGLAVAQLALDMNRSDESREALLAALESARAIVSRSLSELRREGIPLAELLGDAVAV